MVYKASVMYFFLNQLFVNAYFDELTILFIKYLYL